MDLQFSEEAADFFREISLFDRLPLVDLFDEMRIGKIPDGDYGEITEEGVPVSVLNTGKFAISYSVKEDNELI